jgi:hypothetical protein
MKLSRPISSLVGLFVLPAALALICGCVSTEGVSYNPTPQLLPQNVKKLALDTIVNQTQQFGLEDKLTLSIRDEFLRDGNFPLVPREDADGIVLVTISHYILTPIQYDATLIPTSYELRIDIDLKMIDSHTNTTMWDEPNLEGLVTYAAQTLPGGKTEEQAREDIWDILARDVVKRVVQGFGSVTGTTARQLAPNAPSTAPTVQPGQSAPITPTIPNAY